MIDTVAQPKIALTLALFLMSFTASSHFLHLVMKR